MEAIMVVAGGIATAITVMGTQLIKKYDKKRKLKSIQMLLVLLLSAVSTVLTAIAGIYKWAEVPLYVAVVFTVSVLFHNQIWKRFKAGVDAVKSTQKGS